MTTHILATGASLDLESIAFPGKSRAEKPEASAHARQPAIARDEILVVAKRSRLERDMQKKNISEDESVQYYNNLGESGLSILASHLCQKEAADVCRAELSDGQVIRIEELEERQKSGRYKLIVSLGGDDFFKVVSHHLQEGQSLLGVNSDPTLSRGVLLPTKYGQLPEAFKAITAGDYRLEPWTRLRLRIDGKDCGPATNEIALGKRDFRRMSRHLLEYRGEKVLQRSSGMLISTGVGSTGWFASAGLYLGLGDRSFPKSAPFARFELREPYVSFEERDGVRRPVLPKFVEGTINPGEVLRITSLNDDEGLASRDDAFDEIKFPRGSVAEVSVDPNPLMVLMPNEREVV
jgi:NAD kinase